jgi:hypothetical protein
MLQRPGPRRPFAFLKDLAPGGCKWPMRETADGRHLFLQSTGRRHAAARGGPALLLRPSREPLAGATHRGVAERARRAHEALTKLGERPGGAVEGKFFAARPKIAGDF